jgi:hypothetical protein
MKITNFFLATCTILLSCLTIQSSVKAISFNSREAADIINGTITDRDLGFLADIFPNLTANNFTYLANYTETNWEGTLSGKLFNRDLNIKYKGDFSRFVSEPIIWNSEGFIESNVWNGNGSALFSGENENFQIELNSSANFGTNTIATTTLINGIDTPSIIKYVSNSGNTLINGISQPIENDILIEIPQNSSTIVPANNNTLLRIIYSIFYGTNNQKIENICKIYPRHIVCTYVTVPESDLNWSLLSLFILATGIKINSKKTS